MPDFYPAKYSFLGGLLTQAMHGRADTEAYATGLQACENLDIEPQGALASRAGMRWVADIDNQHTRLYAFKRGGDSDAVVVVDDTQLRLLDVDGFLPVQSGGVLLDPRFSLGMNYWEVDHRSGQFKFDIDPILGTGYAVRSRYYANPSMRVDVYQRVELGPSALPLAVTIDAPVSYYPLDGAGPTLADAAGSNDGTGIGVSYEQSDIVDGDDLVSLGFDGEAVVSVGTPGELAFAGDFTLEAVIRPDAAAISAGQAAIIDYAGGGYSLRLDGGALAFGVSGGADIGVAEDPLVADTTYHVAVRRTSAGVAGYVNGEEVFNEATPGAFTPTRELCIGGSQVEFSRTATFDIELANDPIVGAASLTLNGVTVNFDNGDDAAAIYGKITGADYSGADAPVASVTHLGGGAFAVQYGPTWVEPTPSAAGSADVSVANLDAGTYAPVESGFIGLLAWPALYDRAIPAERVQAHARQVDRSNQEYTLQLTVENATDPVNYVKFWERRASRRDSDEEFRRTFDTLTSVRVGTTKGAADLLDESHTQADWPKKKYRKDALEYTFTPGTREFWVAIRTQLPFGYFAFNYGIQYSRIRLTGPVGEQLAFASPWSADMLPDLHTAMDSSSRMMFFFHPKMPPRRLWFNYDERQWVFDLYAPDNAPDVWGEEGDWPGTGSVFQGRLWTAGHPAKPGRLWATKVNDYEDMDLGLEPDDGLEFDLATNASIRWMTGQKHLLIGTDTGLWIGTSSTGIIVPDDFFFQQQTGYSAGRPQPVLAGDQLLYLSSPQDKVRVTREEDTIRGWTGFDATFRVQDIARDGMRRVEYSLDPGYRMLCLLNSGSLLACTYDREMELQAWTLYTTEGGVLDIAATQGPAGGELWAVTTRNGGIAIEYADLKNGARVALDGHYRFSLPDPTDPETPAQFTLDELERLEGLTVHVVYDPSSPQPRYGGTRVVAEGEIEVDTGYAEAAVGLRFDIRAATLPLEEGNPAGSAQASKRRWVEVVSRLADSTLPLLNGYRAGGQNVILPDGVTLEDAILTGDFNVRSDGYADGVVTIEQDKPLPIRVLGLFGKATEKHT